VSLIPAKAYKPIVYATLALFLAKGLQYALIGSYLPLMVFGGLGLIVVLAIQRPGRLPVIAVRFWAIVLMVMGGLRLLLDVIFLFSERPTEMHIREHFTLVGRLLSLLTLVVGLYLFRQAKQQLKT